MLLFVFLSRFVVLAGPERQVSSRHDYRQSDNQYIGTQHNVMLSVASLIAMLSIFVLGLALMIL